MTSGTSCGTSGAIRVLIADDQQMVRQGFTVLLNAQPFSVVCNKGKVAIAHNGTSPMPTNCAPTWAAAAPSSRRPAIPKSFST